VGIGVAVTVLHSVNPAAAGGAEAPGEEPPYSAEAA
jgi:hypothetical protein